MDQRRFFCFQKTDYFPNNKGLHAGNGYLLLLTNQRELVAYKHNGFWRSLDTYKDYLNLNTLWEKQQLYWPNYAASKQERAL